MQKRHRKKQKLFLISALLLALGLHAGAIYLLYDSVIPLGLRPLKKSSQLCELEKTRNKELKKIEHQEIISDLFTKLTKASPSPPKRKDDFEELSPELAPPPPVFLPDTHIDTLFCKSESYSITFDGVYLEKKPKKCELPDTHMILALATPEAELPEDLTKAMMGMQGEVSSFEEDLKDEGLAVGNAEDIGKDLIDFTRLVRDEEQDRLQSILNQALQLEESDLDEALALLCPQNPTSAASSLSKQATEHFPDSDFFDINLEYAAKCSRPGYVFKITLTPRKNISFKRIRQNFFFLIDRSNSIARYRYNLMRKAVSESLALLQQGDTFNILVFDDRVVRLSTQNLLWTPENVAKARLFLERQAHGGMFAATDLYASLGKIIPKAVTDAEINTAILLSDGDTFLSLDKQRQMIGAWTKHNEGKVALFSIASGVGNNLPLLELLSIFNKGKLLYAPEHYQVKERLVHLMKKIKNPIGKSMIATAVTPDKRSKVLLQPKNCRLPDLYQGNPYILYGSTNRLSDFTLFVQGQYYDRAFDIKKRISFKQATNGTLSLEREWTQLLAHDFFERFFKDGNESHLESAKQLLSPLNLPIPFLNKTAVSR